MASFHSLLEMAYVGTFDDIYHIYVYANEGNIPHFHFRTMNKEEGCIRIDKPEYFNHGNKQQTLNSKEIKELIKLLTSIEKDTQKTYYKYLIILWNANNPNHRLSIDTEMPDYTQINNYNII